MTYVQNNSVFYPAKMASHMGGSAIRGLTILHCVLFALYLLVSISYWFPITTSRVFNATAYKGPATFINIAVVLTILSAIGEFFVNFGIHVDDVGAYNSIDNFYNPAACGQTRQLKSGILLVANAGKMYNMMWTSWCLIYIFAAGVLLSRVAWLSSHFDNYVREEATRRSTRDVERAAVNQKKAAEEFRAEVEKEKEKIRLTALQEVKAEVAQKKEAEAIGVPSTRAGSSEDSAPPYVAAK